MPDHTIPDRADPTVAFIVPHKGRTDMLAQTLRSVFEQNTALTWQICVATQEPDLSLTALGVPQDAQVRLLHAPASLTISELRNLGLEQSRSEFVVFLDADVQLSPNWLEAMYALLTNNPDYAIVSAIQANSQDAPVLERIRTALSNAKTDAEVDFLPGRNLFMRRVTVETIGGFPPHLVTCEDYYFTDQARRQGRLFYSSQASYIHLGEDKAFWPMFKKEIWRGQSNFQSVRGRYISWREIPSFIMPLLIPAGLLILLIGVWAGFLGLSVAGAGIVLLPPLLYSLRLKITTGKDLPLTELVKFYLLYFPARAYGTIRGLFAPITHSGSSRLA
ncbi:mycofactocin system glycosyltransferase [Thiorhodovibrio winogradskyi]|uniref:Mycofactocin system glycosyltransferase n=1 Tax=Thiorhodovibrio winogradskyi TaxID=77007 RepID=A0ABZ0SB24_9GAMM|nr:glycosyltransferase family A protein [Thiorhodovibrio winogradskyi]